MFGEITWPWGLQDVVNDPKHSAALATHKALDLMGGVTVRQTVVEHDDFAGKWWILPGKNVVDFTLNDGFYPLNLGFHVFLANWWDWRLHKLDTNGQT